MSKIMEKRILIVSGILIILFLVFFLIPKKVEESKSPPINIKTSDQIEKLPGDIKTKTAFLKINDLKYESEIKDPISIYDFMEKLKIEGKIDFKEKNYIGMGKLIEEINGIKNSGELNWIYYVNGQKANIGVSNYKINNGDIVSWKYEKSY